MSARGICASATVPKPGPKRNALLFLSDDIRGLRIRTLSALAAAVRSETKLASLLDDKDILSKTL
jgi:hypothetical protein